MTGERATTPRAESEGAERAAAPPDISLGRRGGTVFRPFNQRSGAVSRGAAGMLGWREAPWIGSPDTLCWSVSLASLDSR